MKVISTILLFSIFTLFGTSAYAQGRRSVVSVKVHREKNVPRAGFRIRFIEMVEDSRCPTDTNCVWAGNAKVKIEARSGRGRAKTFELNTTLAQKTVSFAGYDIELSGLTPRPRSNIRINPNGYVATFEVTRSGR